MDEMTLREIVLREIRLPLREPFITSVGEMRERRVLLVWLRDEDGVSTWSECVALASPSYLPETLDTAWYALSEWLVPRLLGRSFSSTAGVDAALREGVRGHRMARAALEMGVWALLAQRSGKRLTDLLAASAGEVSRARVPTGIAIGLPSREARRSSIDALVAKVGLAVDEGYPRVKIKIAPGMDLEPLTALRDAFPDLALTADANSAYTLDQAAHLARLDPLELSMIEQPLAWDDLLRHADLQKLLHTPICLDESVTGPRRVEDMARLGSGKIVNLKPGRVGGFTASLQVRALCRRHGFGLWCGGMLESGIGRAYNVALAALPGFDLPGDLSPSARYWERDIVRPEWAMDGEGGVAVPSAPGLGVEVDEGLIENLTMRKTSQKK